MKLHYYSSIKILILGLLFQSIAFIGVGQTQDPKFELVRESNGISLGKINAITQDKFGFLWLSDQTNHCIIRYDGRYMERFPWKQASPHSPNSLGGYYPETLLSDEHGGLWIGFWGQGLDYYNPFSNTFTHYKHDPENPSSLANDYVSVVLKDHLGQIWVGTSSGLDLLDPETGTFTHFQPKDQDATSLSHPEVRALYEDRAGALWVGTGFGFNADNEGGLNQFNRATQTFTRYLHDPEDPQSISNNKVRAILEDSKGNFWVGTGGDGIQTLNRSTGKFTRYTYEPLHPEKLARPPILTEDDHISFIQEDQYGSLWFGTIYRGIIRYNPETKALQHYGSQTDNSSAYTDNSSWALFPAKDGQLWLTTQGSNLFKIDLRDSKIYNEQKELFPYLSTSSKTVWYGVKDALIREDLKQGTKKMYRAVPNDPKSLSNKQITQIYQDRQGKIWVGTAFGLNLYQEETDNFQQFVPSISQVAGISHPYISFLYEDSDSNFWIGTEGGGLNLMDRSTGTFSNQQWNPLNSNSISSDYISTICEDQEAWLWIGNRLNGGLNRLDKATGNFTRFLPGLSILNLYSDHNFPLLVGTSNGLYAFDSETDEFYLFLDIGFIHGIIKDQQGNVWAGTAQGVFKLNQQKDKIQKYPIDFDLNYSALTPNWRTTNVGYAHQTVNDEIQMGHFSGYYHFKPSELISTQDTTQLYFTNFWVGKEQQAIGSAVLPKSLFETDSIQLKYHQNTFSISFSAIDFRNGAQEAVAYQLENYDPDWRTVAAGERVTYFKIPPGKYLLSIKPSAGHLSKYYTQRTLEIIISAPWWNTYVAYFLYAILMALLIYLVHRYQRARILRIEREKTKDRELEQARKMEQAYSDLSIAHQALQDTKEQLVQQEKLASLGQLTAGIAHEIKNPLNFVNNFSEVSSELIEEALEEVNALETSAQKTELSSILQDVKTNLEKIYSHGNRADGIVQSMLLHSRGGSGKKQATDLNNLIQEYAKLAFHGMRASKDPIKVEIDLKLDPSLEKTQLIQEDFSRVVLNLCNNAFDAMRSKLSNSEQPYEPVLTISTYKKDQQVVLEIQDNGPGIPKELKDKVLEPFFTTKKGTAGTGLGLSISHDIIKAHGGTLDIQSKKGKGSTFLITLVNR